MDRTGISDDGISGIRRIVSVVVVQTIVDYNVHEAIAVVAKAIVYVVYMVVDLAYGIRRQAKVIVLVFDFDDDNRATIKRNVVLDVRMDVENNGQRHVAISFVHVIIDEDNEKVVLFEDVVEN